MKRVIAILAVLVMLLTVFAGCSTKENNSGLNAAKQYLETMYRTEAEETAAAFTVTAVVTINTVKYAVEWSVDKTDNVTIEKKDDYSYTVNVFNDSADKVEYVLTATIKDEKGKSVTATFKHYIPGVAQGTGDKNTYTLATELKDGDSVIIYSPAFGLAISEEDLSEEFPLYRKGEAISVSGNTITTNATQIIWEVRAVDGGFQFYSDDNKTLSCTGRKLYLANTDTVWAIRAAHTENCVYIESTTGKGSSGDPYTIEWYESYSEFSTYYYSEYSEANEKLFALQLFTLPNSADITPIDPVVSPTPSEDDNSSEAPVDPTDGVEFTLTTTIKDGDQVVIYNAGAGVAMSEEDLSAEYPNYRKGVKVTLVDGKIVTSTSAIVWTVKAVEGGFQFVSDTGATLSCTGRKLLMAETDNVWEVKTATSANSVYLYSTTLTGSSGDPVAIEWYAQFSEFSSFYHNSSSDESLFAMQIYLAPEGAVITPPSDGEDTSKEPSDDPIVGDGSYTLSTTIKDGDQVVIYNAGAGVAMSEEDLSAEYPNYRKGVAVTVSNGKISTDNSKIVWTVKAVTGGFQFVSDSGATLSCTGRKLLMGDTDNIWEVKTATSANSVYLYSTTLKGSSGDPVAIEWYAQFSEFSSFYHNSSSDESLFALQLYVLSE